MTIIGNPADFNQKMVWTIQVRNRQDYPLFLLKAHLYLALRGIPYSLQHKMARELIRTSHRMGGGLMTPLTVQEEALVFARIPLREPTGLQEVDPSQGIIKSPETAKVIHTFVTNPPSNGGHRVFPGDKRFLLEVWTTPRIQNNRLVSAPVGGFVERVLVKAGDGVQKNQELVHLRYPFLEDPWPYHPAGCPAS